MVSSNYRFLPARTPTGAAEPAKPTSERFPPNPSPVARYVIGQVDTGIVVDGGAAHPWLGDHVNFDPTEEDVLDRLSFRTIPGSDFAVIGQEPNRYLDPSDAHGTFVAGLMIQQAPEAGIMMRGVLDDLRGDDATVAAAIDALAATDVKVITLAFSGFPAEQTRPALLEAAIDRLASDVVVVAAAGNLGTSTPVWPAAFPRVIAVGAIDTSGGVRDGEAPPLASFSGYGKWVDVYANGVDVLGPYVVFTEADGEQFAGWATWSGTSFAAAQVAGKIANCVITEGISAPDAAAQVLEGPPVEIPDMPWIRRPFVATDPPGGVR